MARQPRFLLPGQPQHVIQRGNNRQAIFCSPNDYEYFLEKLFEAAQDYDCHVHAYVLMTNHIHLLLTPLLEGSISKVMQVLGRYYVQYFNYNHHRTGTLWEGRYKASLIDTEHYLLRCMRYIELNPVRANTESMGSDSNDSLNLVPFESDPIDLLIVFYLVFNINSAAFKASSIWSSSKTKIPC